MHMSRAKFIVAGVFMLGTAAAAWMLMDAKPPVSLTVVSYATNRWPEGRPTCVRAMIGVTNNRNRSFTYLGYSARRVEYEVLSETPEGWKAPLGFRCGAGLMPQTLSPGQGFTFEAIVNADERCKVQFMYSNGTTPSRVWQRLPSWLTQKLPWSSPWRTATTEPIDLREPRI